MSTDFGLDDPVKKYLVLKAAEDQCRPVLSDGKRGEPFEGDEAIQLSIEGISPEEISDYCFILGELGLLKVAKFRSIDGVVTYPVSLTRLGSNFLSEAERSLWENAKLTAIEIIKERFHIDLNHPAFRALQAAFRQFKQEWKSS